MPDPTPLSARGSAQYNLIECKHACQPASRQLTSMAGEVAPKAYCSSSRSMSSACRWTQAVMFAWYLQTRAFETRLTQAQTTTTTHLSKSEVNWCAASALENP